MDPKLKVRLGSSCCSISIYRGDTSYIQDTTGLLVRFGKCHARTKPASLASPISIIMNLNWRHSSDSSNQSRTSKRAPVFHHRYSQILGVSSQALIRWESAGTRSFLSSSVVRVATRAAIRAPPDVPGR